MKRRIWIVVAVVAVLALAGAYFASPLLAFRALVQAAQAGDRAGLERMVDFPAVRDSLKSQLGERLMGALERDAGLAKGPFGQLGALLGPAIVDQVVDAAITPDGVAAIVRTGRAPLSDIVPGRAAPPPPAEPGLPGPPREPPANTKLSTRFAYLDLDHFRARTVSSDAPEAPLGWVLERRGLFSWKLVRIELPPT